MPQTFSLTLTCPNCSGQAFKIRLHSHDVIPIVKCITPNCHYQRSLTEVNAEIQIKYQNVERAQNILQDRNRVAN